MRNVLDPLDLVRSNKYRVLRFLREFERSQYWSRERLQEQTDKRLARLISHAYKYCPFYRRRLDSLNLHPSEFRTAVDFTTIPVLEKQDVQQYRDEMVAVSWPKHDLSLDQTGGSTGQPISYFLSFDRICSREAATRRHNAWANYHVGDKLALVWGAQRDAPVNNWRRWLRNLLLDRQLYLDTACITESEMASFNCSLKAFKPHVIQAYAKSLVFFARYLQDTGQVPYQPRAIITSAEMLEEDERELLEMVFGCAVYNRYGCREFSVVASECNEHRGMHIMAEGLHVEILRRGKPVAPGEVGEIVVTDLLNFAMPMIRYRIGDMATIDIHPCPCGRGLPRLKNLAGRVTDFVVGVDGRLVSGVFLATYVVAKCPKFGRLQIRQDAAGSVKYLVTARIGDTSEADREFLKRETRRYLGDSMNIELEHVEALPHEPSGKFLFCKSTVAADAFSSSMLDRQATTTRTGCN